MVFWVEFFNITSHDTNEAFLTRGGKAVIYEMCLIWMHASLDIFVKEIHQF